ncbi:YkgJ family cysteine cluster protein [Thiorhodococcus mannitoliphagus]|uniref:YkgJ family cysteine cluster protein n=1 Tax=Thiorhodococcus mannitoliphagus TaxID=329406 RepID=A0A6P1DV97_9GAMM|nr:YkgJ family cysteine cluster protein [Thiorhodococcus mannitoliphagus]NEX22267.1 YkgJ family cysteine cluster protein [Thiorhodococcus mannitoliphagus]
MSAKSDILFSSALMPQALRAESQIRFRCYKGISCFNACCKQADVTLTPYDILRLKRRLGLTSTVFLREHAVPFQMDGDGLPGVKLKTDDSGACLQLDGDAGCAVFSDRPTVCRYYPLAFLALREKDASHAEERYSLVKESHCKGHDEQREISVAEYREEQGCEDFDAANREWYQLILKKKSAGPSLGRPPQRSLQLFFMASYDLDTFRRFVLSENFRNTYSLPDDFYTEVEQHDEALLRFSYRFLRQVLFGERSVQEVADAWDRRVAQRKDVWDARRALEAERRLAAEDAKYAAGGDGGAS